MDIDNFMSKYSNLYKAKNTKKVDSKALENDRRDKRRATVNARRNIEEEKEVSENIPPVDLNVAETRKLKLDKWKKKKEEALKNSKISKKPFVVGVYHHKVNSPIFPPLSDKKGYKIKPLIGSSQNIKRQTRADSKKKVDSSKPLSPKGNINFAFTSKVKPSSVFKFKAAHLSSTKKLTNPESPFFMKREAAKKKKLKEFLMQPPQLKKQESKHSSSDEELALPLSPSTRVTRSQQVKDKNCIRILKAVEKSSTAQKSKGETEKKEIESQDCGLADTAQQNPTMTNNDEDKSVTSKMNDELNENKEYINNFTISPFVTVERGKRHSKRNSMLQARQRISLRDVPAEDEPEDGPTFQKNRLYTETARLLQLAEKWEQLTRLENVNQEIIDEIYSTVGQTRLLTNDKFQQFRNLIEQHEADGSVKVTLEDLNGFWEMMYLQVENLNKKYNELEILQSNNWSQPEPVTSERDVKPKKCKTKKPMINAKSSVLDFIRAKKARNNDSNTGCANELVNKRRSSVSQNSPAAFNALKQSFIAKEFGKHPVIMMTPDVVQTPRSCLKMKPEGFVNRSVKKTVLFNETIDVQLEEPSSISCPLSTSTTKELSPGDVQPAMFTPRRSARLSIKKELSPGDVQTAMFTPRRSARLSIKKALQDSIRKSTKLSPAAPKRLSNVLKQGKTPSRRSTKLAEKE